MDRGRAAFTTGGTGERWKLRSKVRGGGRPSSQAKTREETQLPREARVDIKSNAYFLIFAVFWNVALFIGHDLFCA